MKIFKVLAGLLFAVTASVALAHHSAVMFDFQNTVVVEGKVKEVRFANPHMKLILEVSDAKGTREIEYEGHSRNNMARQGLTPNLFKVGDSIAIRIAPMRNGEDGGYVTAVRGPDGTEVGRVTGAD
ncbi:MAG: DUF6152 family protein [Gammaproteobacteria bacterium]